MSTKCFLLIDSDELETRTKKAKNANTDKSEKRADKAFCKFLMALGKEENDIDYWNYDEPSLDNYLAHFWFGARKDICEDNIEEEDPEMKDCMYSANTLKNFRYGLNGLLKSKGHLYDIIDRKTASFTKSQ